MWPTLIRCGLANLIHRRYKASKEDLTIRHPEFSVVTILVTLLFASSVAAIRQPDDYDVVDYLSFVAYMGPTAHDCWNFNKSRRPNIYPGIMFARIRKGASIYHGTVDGSWANESTISANSFYGTNQWYPTLHVLGKSYFTGGVLPKNYKREPQQLKDPKIIEYLVADTNELYLYAYDFFPEKFVNIWIKVEQDSDVKNFFNNLYNNQKMKANIAGVKTISKHWNTQFKIPIQGFIQRRAIQGPDVKTLAKGVVGRREGRSDGNLNGINVMPNISFRNKKKFSALFENEKFLHYDEVVYFGIPKLPKITTIHNPKDHPDAILRHIGTWLKACESKINDTPLPYMLDYRTYWPWNNFQQSFQGRNQTLAVKELQDLDLDYLRYWNNELQKKLYSDLMPLGEYVEAKTFFFNRLVHSISDNEYITSKDIAKIRFAAFDLLQRYCKMKKLTNYYICNYSEVKTLPSHTSTIRITTEKESNKIIEVDIQPSNRELKPWLF